MCRTIGKVVGDENHRQAVFLLEVEQEVEDLRLDGDVQGADRLVADEEGRPEGKGPRDGHPLALSPGELVRVASADARGEAHLAEQLLDARAAPAGSARSG